MCFKGVRYVVEVSNNGAWEALYPWSKSKPEIMWHRDEVQARYPTKGVRVVWERQNLRKGVEVYPKNKHTDILDKVQSVIQEYRRVNGSLPKYLVMGRDDMDQIKNHPRAKDVLGENYRGSPTVYGILVNIAGTGCRLKATNI